MNYSIIPKKLIFKLGMNNDFGKNQIRFYHTTCFCKLITAFILVNKAGVLKLTGKWDDAQEKLHEAMRMARKIKAIRLNAMSAFNLGMLMKGRGDFHKSYKMFLKAKELYEQIQDNKGRALATGNLGVIHYLKGNYNLAMKYHSRHLEAAERENDLNGMGQALNHMGNVHYFKGDYIKAFGCYKRFYAIAIKGGGLGYKLHF